MGENIFPLFSEFSFFRGLAKWRARMTIQSMDLKRFAGVQFALNAFGSQNATLQSLLLYGMP